MSLSHSQMRIGNTDRDECVDKLADFVASGHLAQHEFEQRRDRALVCTTRGQLDNLTEDLPGAKPPVKRYKTQVAGNAVPFSYTRWISAIAASMAFIVIPGPIMAAVFHGFGNAPGHGALPLLMIMAGCAGLLVTGIGFAPDGYDRPDTREYY